MSALKFLVLNQEKSFDILALRELTPFNLCLKVLRIRVSVSENADDTHTFLELPEDGENEHHTRETAVLEF